MLHHMRNALWTYQGIVVMFVILLCVGWLSRYAKNKIKSYYYAKFEHEIDKENNDEVLVYYEKRHLIDVITLGLYMAVIWVYLFTIQFDFGFLSIAVGATILTFQPVIRSLIGYLVITTKYHIGDTIHIGDTQWDIIGIKLLYTIVSSKNDLNEHTGEVHHINNSTFLFKTCIKSDLRWSGISKNIISIYYNSEVFHQNFPELLELLRSYLHDKLPVRNIEECGMYKSYIGHKFKLNSGYDDSGRLKITLGYLDTFANVRTSNEEIITFIEQIKIS